MVIGKALLYQLQYVEVQGYVELQRPLACCAAVLMCVPVASYSPSGMSMGQPHHNKEPYQPYPIVQ